MDKTKTYDKHADVDSRTGQPGDMSWWQREMLKKFVAGGNLDSDIPAPPYFAPMPWPYPQHLWSHPLFQHLAHSAMPQSPGQTHEQEKEHEGHQGGTEALLSDKSQPSHNGETSGPSSGTGRYPLHSVSADSHHDDLHMGGTRPPYSYPGGFIFPPPPYPGQLDPLMLWMHHMRRQAAYLYSIPGCRNGYQSPLPVPSAGANQRGFIKIPSGIPQKQTQLWETQSSENMQLWATITQLCATVARAEAEIFCQRGKILKLEDDLQIMKTRQDALSDALKGTTVAPQARRERRKRTAAVPVAILGLPALHSLPARAQVKKARGSMNEAESFKPTSELASEGNCEQRHQNNVLELTNGSTQSGNGNCTSPTVGLNQSETMDKDVVDRQHTTTDLSPVDMSNSALRQENQNSIRGSLPVEMTRETDNLQIKQECITDSVTNLADRSKEGADFDGEKDESCVVESNAKQTLYSGDCCRDSEMLKRDVVCIAENMVQQRADAVGASVKSELTVMGKRDNRLEGVVIASTADSIHGGLLSNNTSLARPNAINSGNAVPDWHHALQNGQVGASTQREAINACTLDGFDGPDEWTEEVMEVLK